MTSLRVAITTLTLLPAARDSASAAAISSSRAFYPLVGLLVGGLVVGVAAAASTVLDGTVTAAIVVVSLMLATRGFHLDGLMDTCDGLFGGYTAERRLQIMRDTQVGAFGVAGTIGVTLLKWTAILAILESLEPARWWALLLFPVVSRWTVIVAIAAFPYARAEGLGTPFKDVTARWATVVAAAFTVVIAAAVAGTAGLLVVAVTTAGAWLLCRTFVSMLGGLTGDTYGATNEVSEVVALITALALLDTGLLDPAFGLL